MKKIVMLCAVVIALVTTISCSNNQYDGKTVLYPTTELVTDSFAIESTATVWKATVHVKGHLYLTQCTFHSERQGIISVMMKP